MAQISTRTAGGDPTPPDDSKGSSSGLSIPQIVAGALAAATAAILGSFMGVAGTIGGAAVASVISTVGSSLYQRSLERTRDAVKDRLVVNAAAGTKVAQAVAKVTGDGIPVASPQNAPRPPGARPGAGARPPGAPAPGGPPNRGAVPPLPTHRLPDGGLAPGRRQVGTPQPAPQAAPTQQAGAPQQLRAGGRTVTTRLDAAGRPAPADPTRRIPDARTPDGPPRGPDGRLLPPGPPGTPPRGTGPADPTRRVGVPGMPTPPPGVPMPRPGGDPTTAYLGAMPDDDPTQLAGAVEKPRRKHTWKTWVTLGGVAASIFAIGLLASFAVESAAGHPLSGGSSGTSVGSLFGESTNQPPTSSEAPSTDNTDGSQPSTTDSSQPSGAQQTRDSGSNTSRTTTPSTSRQSPNNNGGGGGVLSSLVPQ